VFYFFLPRDPIGICSAGSRSEKLSMTTESSTWWTDWALWQPIPISRCCLLWGRGEQSRAGSWRSEIFRLECWSSNLLSEEEHYTVDCNSGQTAELLRQLVGSSPLQQGHEALRSIEVRRPYVLCLLQHAPTPGEAPYTHKQQCWRDSTRQRPPAADSSALSRQHSLQWFVENNTLSGNRSLESISSRSGDANYFINF
jgi:hypothetical protein